MQGDYLRGTAVVVDRPAVREFADIEDGDIFIEELGFGADGAPKVGVPEVVPVVLVTLA